MGYWPFGRHVFPVLFWQFGNNSEIGATQNHRNEAGKTNKNAIANSNKSDKNYFYNSNKHLVKRNCSGGYF